LVVAPVFLLGAVDFAAGAVDFVVGAVDFVVGAVGFLVGAAVSLEWTVVFVVASAVFSFGRAVSPDGATGLVEIPVPEAETLDFFSGRSSSVSLCPDSRRRVDAVVGFSARPTILGDTAVVEVGATLLV
jgi:hypothetical protein